MARSLYPTHPGVRNGLFNAIIIIGERGTSINHVGKLELVEYLMMFLHFLTTTHVRPSPLHPLPSSAPSSSQVGSRHLAYIIHTPDTYVSTLIECMASNSYLYCIWSNFFCFNCNHCLFVATNCFSLNLILLPSSLYCQFYNQ